MSEPMIHCQLCGTQSSVQETDREQVHVMKHDHIYVCPVCVNKIRYESENNLKS